VPKLNMTLSEVTLPEKAQIITKNVRNIPFTLCLFFSFD
jgi:hypothetical protein